MTKTLRATGAALATFAFVLVIVLTPGTWTASASDVLAQLRQPGEAAFVVAHRGDSSSAPENTVPAFEAALRSGSTVIETDVRLTADGYAVIIHDDTVDRTTNGTGKVSELTLTQLRSLDAGSWYDPSFAGTRVPVLAEFLDVIASAPDVTALIELKGRWAQAQILPLISAIYFRGLQDRVVFASFSTRSLVAVQEVDPVLPRVLIREELPHNPVLTANKWGVVALLVPLAQLDENPDAVSAMHGAGLRLMIYTLNTEAEWDAAVAWGVDGIVSDTPAGLHAWISETTP